MKLALPVSACLLSAITCVLVVRAEPPDAASTGSGFRTLPVTTRRAHKQYAAPTMSARVELGTSDALAPPKTLTMSDLHAMLANLNLNPTTNTGPDGSSYEVVHEARGNCTFAYMVFLSASKNYIWINCWLTSVKDADNTKPVHFYKLLGWQETLWPAYFTYDATEKELLAQQSLQNANVTQASLRKTIDGFLDKLVASSSLWDTSQWVDSSAPAATVPVSR